jgi:hypothetical protein
MKIVDHLRLQNLLDNRPEIPEGELDRVKIEHVHHAPGSNLIVVSPRNAIFMDQRPTRLIFHQGYKEQQLSYEGGVWMTDTPQEIWQMDEIIKIANGNVVVGGLGLGIVSHLISLLNHNVKVVVTVEKDQRVIDLVSDYIAHDVCDLSDIHEWLDTFIPGTADFMFLDTWQSTGETTWFEQIVPLRRKCRTKIEASNVLCWNEEEMMGQLRQGAHKHVDLPDTIQGYHNTVNVIMRRAAVRQGIRSTFYSLEQIKSDPMLMVTLQHKNEQDQQVVNLFERLMNPGTDQWEQEFGDMWDRAVEEKNRYEERTDDNT